MVAGRETKNYQLLCAKSTSGLSVKYKSMSQRCVTDLGRKAGPVSTFARVYQGQMGSF